MSTVYILIGIGGFIFILAVLILIINMLIQRKAVMKRAKKIDPSVKTMVEADYVLKKDIAQSVGANNQK